VRRIKDVKTADLFLEKGRMVVFAFLRCTSWFLPTSPARILSTFDRIGERKMRRTYRNVLKNHFHVRLVQIRTTNSLTQSEMAERLSMDDRSYIDLDHGKTCCSAVTLALFLVYVCEDVHTFLEELRHAFNTAFNQAA
jgi:DNA-binding XRE family transcriptional regulator